MKAKKIAVFVSSLELGGITSFVIGLVNYLASKGHDISLYYTFALDEKIKLLDERIKTIKFKRESNRSVKVILCMLFCGYIGSIFRIKFRDHSKSSSIKDNQRVGRAGVYCMKPMNVECDIAISSSEFFCNDFLAFKVNAPYKIGWIHPDLSKLDIDRCFISEAIKRLNKVVAVSEACKNSLVNIFPDFKEKFVSIENILPQETIKKMSLQEIDDVLYDDDRLNIVTVARIDNSSKRFDRIIRACRYFCDKNMAFHWYIVGDGADLNMLKKMAEEYHVNDYITFLGARANPYPYVSKADVFVLTSHYEGQPIAVDEALALHCPCVVTNYKSAHNQVDSKYGCVIENNDETISEELFNVLFSNDNLKDWKTNLEDYSFDNSIIYKKIDKLLGSDKVDKHSCSHL